MTAAEQEPYFEPDSTETEQLAEVQYFNNDITGQYLHEISRTPLLTAEEEVDLSKAIEAGLMAQRMLEDETLDDTALHEELAWIAEAGEAAKNHMIQANLRLVASTAKRYRDKGMDYLDIISEGNLGLEHAVKKFDYQKGYKFSTYATWWIRQAIHTGFRERGYAIRLTKHQYELTQSVMKARRNMVNELNRDPSEEEIALELDMEVEVVREIILRDRGPLSLQTVISSESGMTLEEVIADKYVTPEFEDSLVQQELHDSLQELMKNCLNDREIAVVCLRNGIGIEDGQTKSLKEVAQELTDRYGGRPLSAERIRQIYNKAMRSLATAAENQQHLKNFMRD